MARKAVQRVRPMQQQVGYPKHLDHQTLPPQVMDILESTLRGACEPGFYGTVRVDLTIKDGTILPDMQTTVTRNYRGH